MTGPTVRRWRGARSLPGSVLRMLLRGAAGAAAAVAAAGLHRAHDPGVLCPLRLVTGVPCPVCGSTTVFIEAGQGHWAAALGANPVTVAVAVGLLFAPLGPGRWWSELPAGRRNTLVAAALAAAWVWQLERLGISRP
ncbi:DUF2752 domain-containing protein [Streptomyces sp. CB03911]|uniref:DUF2752 domain-containing protein n=1 Tax=Streptomycetaceae TaxID=2062 RepID=UPI0009A10FD3|nr:DUF2752 domain-containing protein [Streptomyces sp. CB03911]